jgi:hypothetical protein
MKTATRSTDVDGLNDLCRRAAQILVTPGTRQRYPNGFDVIYADPIQPPPPSTRKDATPNILLVGPFQGEPDLIGVDIYAGIGFIEVRNLNGALYSYGLSAIDGAGQEIRVAYLETALRLYFDDVKFQENNA